LGTAGIEQTFEKAARNWHDDYDEAATLKAHRLSLVFLFCNIHTQTGYYKKRNMSFGCKFSQLQHYQILLK